MGQTPLYLLCEKGFRLKPDKDMSRKQILEKLILEGADWSFVCPSIKYTPLHWLGYWNDVSAILLLFETFDKLEESEKMKNFQTMMSLSSNGVTPLDVAAKNRSHTAAILMVDQFIKRKAYISQIF